MKIYCKGVSGESRITVYLNDKMYSREHDSFDWGEDSIYMPKKDDCLDAEPGNLMKPLVFIVSCSVNGKK